MWISLYWGICLEAGVGGYILCPSPKWWRASRCMYHSWLGRTTTPPGSITRKGNFRILSSSRILLLSFVSGFGPISAQSSSVVNTSLGRNFHSRIHMPHAPV